MDASNNRVHLVLWRPRFQMKYIVIGASTAGSTAAQYLREKSPQAEITVFTNEAYPYYGRPRLVEFLAGEVELHQIYFHDDQWYETNRIDLRKNATVTKLDLEKHHVFTGEESFEYDKLLLATGARPADVPFEGVGKGGVFTLWTASDAIHIRQTARDQESAVVVGGGFLGVECAASLRYLGLEVTLVEVADRLLPKALDMEGAELLRGMLEREGISIKLGETVESVEASATRVESVHLGSGTDIRAGMVLVAAGIVPNKEIAQAAGLVANRGVIVDKHMRTSSTEVYAAGDVAEFAGKCYGTITAALEQARVAASNMTVEDAVIYEGTVSSYALKVPGIDVTVVGATTPEVESKYQVVRVSYPDDGIYKKALFDKEVLAGVILIGSRKNIVPLTTIVNRKLDVSSVKDTLLDEEVNLQDFIRQSEG
jgi:nitrite reductase (NADH) large subunit